MRSTTDGRFEIEVSIGRHMHRFCVGCSGYAEARVWVSESNAQSVVIDLHPGHSLRGRILSPAGEGIEGAKLCHGHSHSLTGRDGEFEILDLPAGWVELRIKAHGYAPRIEAVEVSASEAQDIIHVSLDPGHRLHGRLLDDDGEPVSSALIGAVVRALDSASRSAFSDAEGWFVIEDLPAETASVEVTGAGFDTVLMPVALDGGEVEIRLPISRRTIPCH